MLRANIYAIEPLTLETRGAIEDGIGMVATYMGHTAVTKELGVRLPLNERGHVNPERVGFGKLDKLVELHLMAVPLDPGEGERIGLAGVGRGWGFVDTSKESTDVIRMTTAHEVGHAFGFVVPDADHEDPESSFHCCDGSCVMHKRALIVAEEIEIEQAATRLQKLKRSIAKRRGHEPEPEYAVNYRLAEQFDFCLPCKVDMRDQGDKNIEQLRYNRIFGSKGVK